MGMPNIDPTQCNHRIAVIGGKITRQSDYNKKLSEHEAEISTFNTTRKALPHPGFVTMFQYCSQCGEKLTKL